jgi:hypothetical protein
MPKVKKEKKKEHYFGQTEEKAVRDYINASTQEEKNAIYTKYLHEPITKLVFGIIRKYPKYIGVCGIEELEARAYVQVYNSIQGFKYDKIGKNGQPVKAYSYLGTICHNYCKNHSKDNYKLESAKDDINNYNTDYIEERIKDHYKPEITDHQDFLDVLFKTVINGIEEEIETNKKLKPNDIKVGKALIEIFTNYKEFFPEVEQVPEYTKKGKLKKQKYSNIYKKNKIFYILRELTLLDSKDLRNSIQVFKTFYKIYKNNLLI